MNYRFLAKKQIEKLFDNTNYSVGDIIRAITREEVSGLKSDNRSVLSEKTDQEWYEIIEKVYENERE